MAESFDARPIPEEECPHGHTDPIWGVTATRWIEALNEGEVLAAGLHGRVPVYCREEVLRTLHARGPGAPHPTWAAIAAAGGEFRDYVYVVAGPDSIYKIGKSGTPLHRFKGLAAQSPVPLRLVGFWPERHWIREETLHREFAQSREHGEWFRSWEIDWFVATMPVQYRAEHLLGT